MAEGGNGKKSDYISIHWGGRPACEIRDPLCVRTELTTETINVLIVFNG